MGRRKGSADNRYVHVQPRLWSDEKVARLSVLPPSGQSLWIFLLTCPFGLKVPGVIVAGRAAMAEALGWAQEDFDGAFVEIEEQGLAVADWKSRIVYLPNALKQPENGVTSTAAAVAWRQSLKAMPECELADRIWDEARERVASMDSPHFLKSFDQGQRTDAKPRGMAKPKSAASTPASTADSTLSVSGSGSGSIPKENTKSAYAGKRNGSSRVMDHAAAGSEVKL